MRVLRSEAGLAPGRRAVEIGCGIGSFTRHLAETGATLVAVDLVPELLAQARASTPASNVLFVQGDCTRLDDIPEARAADAVVGNAVLHHLDVRPALESVFRVLVPGGVLALFEPNLVNPQIFVFKHTPMLRRRAGWSPDETAFTRWRLARDVRAAGFTDVRVRPFDFLHPSTPRLLVGAVERLGLFVEKVPLLRELSGSLAVFARKPVAPVV
ncbi:MAG: class I SAM-dependent methyltransferase [Planctomycetes bacterium]|nr:class I SAM-dependent methyltransferase [Planctomycetota bacterium]